MLSDPQALRDTGDTLARQKFQREDSIRVADIPRVICHARAPKQFCLQCASIAAGAWTNPALAHFGVHFPLDVSLEHVVYTTAADPLAYHPSRFPVWIWMDEPCFYGFPIFGEPAVKTAWDRCGLLVDPDTRSFEPDADTVATIRRFFEIPVASMNAWDEITELTRQDKKNADGNILMALAGPIGKVQVDEPITRAEVFQSLKYLFRDITA